MLTSGHFKNLDKFSLSKSTQKKRKSPLKHPQNLEEKQEIKP